MRAGDVIPQVVSPLTPAQEARARASRSRRRSARPAAPPTVKPEDAVFTICPNRAGCPGQSFQHVKHFVSKGAMDIDGLGEKQALRFLAGGPDRRRRRHLRPDRGAAGRARGLRRGLGPQPGRGDRGLARAPLQARPLRARPARRRLRHRRGAGRPLRLDRRAARGRPGGDRGGRGRRADHGRADRRVARRRARPGSWSRSCARRACGWSSTPPNGAPAGGPLEGKTLVLTGTLPELTREEAAALIKAAGGKVDQLGLEEDRLRRRRREPRLEAGQGREARAPRSSTKPACGAAGGLTAA